MKSKLRNPSKLLH